MKYSLRSLLLVLTLVCLVVVLPTLGITLLFSWGVLPRPYLADVEQIPFDSAAWKSSAEIENHRTVRSQMVDQLISSGQLDGMTRDEVESLLGPPHSDLNSGGIDGSRWDTAYHLGLERSGTWSLDEEFLVIRFDAKGQVVEYRIVPN